MASPQTMTALVCRHDGYRRDDSGFRLDDLSAHVELADTALPVPGEGQALIRMRMAAVNPSDIAFIKGVYGQPPVKGRPAGFEGVGEVVASGPDGAADKYIGKRVAFATGRGGSGTWAQYAVAGVEGLIPLVPNVADADGAAMVVNPLTALAMFDLVKESGAGSFVYSAAGSQLGKFLTGLARDHGVAAIAVVRRAGQIGPLIDLGAKWALDATGGDFDERLRMICRDEKPAIFLDAVTGALGGRVFSAMGTGARWVIYGRMDNGPTVIPEPGQLIFQRKRIEGFWLTQWMRDQTPDKRFSVVMEAQTRFATGKWSTDVTAVVPLAEAHARLAAEMAKGDGKVFLTP